jgi:hypothetical protein
MQIKFSTRKDIIYDSYYTLLKSSAVSFDSALGKVASGKPKHCMVYYHELQSLADEDGCIDLGIFWMMDLLLISTPQLNLSKLMQPAMFLAPACAGWCLLTQA